MKCEENAGGFGFGILLGAAIGVAIGMLYAPHSGQETRSMLKARARDAEGRAEVIIEEARERAKKIIADARGKAKEISEG